MSIKGKLLVLIGISCGGMLAAIGVTLLLYMPLEKMQSEQKVLFELENTISGLQSEITALAVEPLQKQRERIETKYRQSSDLFIQLQGLESLSSANEKIALSLSTVESLRFSVEDELETFEQKYREVTNDLELLGRNTKVAVFTLYAESAEQQKNRNFRVLVADLNTLMNQVQLLNTSLRTVGDVMRAEFTTIDQQLHKVRQGIVRTSLLMFILIVVGSSAVALLLARSISRAILHLYKQIRILGEGDLTISVDIRSRDDLQKLGEHMNGFIGGLNQSVRTIKTAAADTIDVKDRLLSAVEHTQSSAESIGETTNTIGSQVEQLNFRFSDSIESVENMAKHSESVLEMLQDQRAMVEESNASVTEMISSIKSVAETSEKRYAATEKLRESSRRGSQKLSMTTGLIQDVTANVDDIREATGVIRNVAAQTSLLAMNAAIEAAHAGEKGAGFAVVAEEIRKLSETTTASSKRIGGILTEVIEKIERTSEVGEQTRLVFDEVGAVVQEVSDSLTEITESMRELSVGGEQILEATSKLQDYSVTLGERGRQMGAATEDLTTTINYTKTTSSKVLDRVSRIGGDVDSINESMRSVGDLSHSLDEVTGRVDAAVKVFTTEKRAEEPN